MKRKLVFSLQQQEEERDKENTRKREGVRGRKTKAKEVGMGEVERGTHLSLLLRYFLALFRALTHTQRERERLDIYYL